MYKYGSVKATGGLVFLSSGIFSNGAIGITNHIERSSRSTGKVLGHGGFSPHAPHNQEFLGDGTVIEPL